MHRVLPFGASANHIAPGVPLLHAEDTVFTAMIEGWEAQQLGSRQLKSDSVKNMVRGPRRLFRFSDEYPWNWNSGIFDEFMFELTGEGLAVSTIRAYQHSIKAFCAYICSEHYGWARECEDRFGTHPVQIVHEENAVAHLQDYEGSPRRRPLTRDELQRLFDHADAEVGRRIDLGRKGALTAYRDAAILKVIYGWGLRANEAATLDVTDFYRNPKAPEFGDYGMLHVRNGKSSRGGAPKRRSVVTVRPWAVEAVRDYIENVWPLTRILGSNTLWVTERGTQLKRRDIADRFAEYRDDLGLESVLSPHAMRHSYATHLIEDGFDPRFVQDQMGHAWGSTTVIYTAVSPAFANRMMEDALSKVFPSADRRTAS